jgi:hypothetical protein
VGAVDGGVVGSSEGEAVGNPVGCVVGAVVGRSEGAWSVVAFRERGWTWCVKGETRLMMISEVLSNSQSASERVANRRSYD